MKKSYTKKTLLSAGIVLLAGYTTTAFANDAINIESSYASGHTATYDNYSGSYPVITAIGSQPGTVDGYSYTTWSFLAQDPTGSIDIYAKSTALGGFTPAVGTSLSVSGTYSPYQQIPEIETITAIAGQGTGTAPTPPVATVSQVNVGVAPESIAGYLVQLDNVTITAVGGGAPGNFPYHANASYTITDATGSMTMYFWATSYSTDAEMASSGVPTGTVDIDGFVDIYTPTSGADAGIGEPEFVPLTITAPEPSVLNLVGAGGLLTLVARLRKKA